MRQEKKKS